MKIVLSLLIITGFAANALAAKWEVDASHSNVTFTVKHMLSKVSGQFTDFAGSFEFDAKKPAASQGEVTIQAKSINTNAAKRDEHLKSADFFDVEKFQTLTFKNGKLTPAGKNKFKLAGELTIHGVTKPATFDVEFLGIAKDPWGGTRSSFEAKTKINRKDFGLVWNKTLDNGGLLVGEEVQIDLQIEATEKVDKKS